MALERSRARDSKPRLKGCDHHSQAPRGPGAEGRWFALAGESRSGLFDRAGAL